MAAEDVKIRLTAQDETKRAFNSVNDNIKKTNTASKGLKKSFGAASGATRQLGYQVQDVAVQLGAGQSAMMVLGQQGSQIASVFGPGGAVVGALIAVASAIGGALLPELFKGNQALKEMDENIKNLRGTLKEGLVSGKGLQTLIDALSLKEVKAVDNLQEAIDTLSDMRLKQRGYQKGEKSLVKQAWEGMFGESPEELDELIIAQELVVNKARKTLRSIRADIAKAQEQIKVGKGKKELIPVKEEELELLDAHISKMIEYNMVQDKTAEAIKRQIDPMYAHLENIKKLNILREEGRLTEEQYAKAVIKSGDIVSQNAAKEIEAKQKQKDADIKTAWDGFNALATHNKKVSKMMKVANIARATMDTYAAANKTLAAYAFPLNVVLTAGVVAAGMANVAAIRGQGMRRFGGAVNAGEAYTVGEQGQETFVPQSAGRIEPNGGGRAINFNITTVDARGFDELLQSRRGMIVNMVNRAMNDRGRIGVTA